MVETMGNELAAYGVPVCVFSGIEGPLHNLLKCQDFLVILVCSLIKEKPQLVLNSIVICDTIVLYRDNSDHIMILGPYFFFASYIFFKRNLDKMLMSIL